MKKLNTTKGNGKRDICVCSCCCTYIHTYFYVCTTKYNNLNKIQKMLFEIVRNSNKYVCTYMWN